jgi:pyridoxal biosynthesis lyase PdxS
MVSLSDPVSVRLSFTFAGLQLMLVLSGDPAKRAKAIVQAVTHYNNPAVLAEVSTDLGDAMVGIST